MKATVREIKQERSKVKSYVFAPACPACGWSDVAMELYYHTAAGVQRGRDDEEQDVLLACECRRCEHDWWMEPRPGFLGGVASQAAEESGHVAQLRDNA